VNCLQILPEMLANNFSKVAKFYGLIQQKQINNCCRNFCFIYFTSSLAQNNL